MPGMNADSDNDYDEEIDPTVYLKCRLCIIENGSFPIHQQLQQQIQYCFDITIKLFDRLPQLICKKCKIILKDFYSTKRTYVENQDKLLEKLNLGKNEVNDPENEPDKKPSETEPESETTETAQTETAQTANVESEDDLFQRVEEESITSSKDKAKKRKNVIFSKSSDSDVDEQALSGTDTDKKKDVVNKDSRVRKASLTWKNSFEEYYICRFCKVPFCSRELVIQHVKTHTELWNRSNKYLKRHCTVSLEKIDEKMNLTGDTKTVVVAPKNIIHDEGHMHYYIKYLPCEARVVIIDENITRSKSKSLKRIMYFDDSSEDDFKDKPQQTKRRKKLSRSSSRDTVVLDGDAKSSGESNAKVQTTNPEPSGDSDVMYIDDSSNEAFDVNTKNKHKHLKRALSGGNSITKIKNIINECYTKYTGSTNKELIKRPAVDDMLNRKLLSVGRKTMSNKGLPTPGLTVYLKKKNLPVTWFPILGSKKNYVRIMTTVDVLGKEPLSGWSDVKTNEDFKHTQAVKTNEDFKNTPDCTPRTVEVTPVIANITANTNIITTPLVTLSTTTAGETTSKVAESTPQATNNHNQKSQNNGDTKPNVQDLRELNVQNYLFGETTSEPQLLNANPVANPKQLPKKQTVFTGTTSTHMPDLDEIRPESEGVMPIILSTTSLAEQPEVSTETNAITSADKANNSTNKQDTTYPRIKCKPVSELLARQPIKLSETNVPHSVAQAKSVGNNVVLTKPGAKPLKIVSVTAVSTAAAAQAWADAQARADAPRVTLNSVHLPNMTTTQPIEYLKKCLNMHSITLLTGLGTKITPSFMCLIKFRLDISLNEQSIVLNLALFGHLSAFCLKLRNPNGEEIDIDNLPAHWQLHILRSFQNNDVSMKLLSCAGKVSKALHENATKFMTVLRDIESV